MPQPRIPEDELTFRTSRAGGPGGQHVNKTATRIEAILDVSVTATLTEDERARVLEKLATRINKQGQLVVACDGARSQLRNKSEAVERLRELIEEALRRPKKRRKRPVPRAVKERRIEAKKRRGQIKSMRKKPPSD